MAPFVSSNACFFSLPMIGDFIIFLRTEPASIHPQSHQRCSSSNSPCRAEEGVAWAWAWATTLRGPQPPRLLLRLLGAA